MRMNTNEEIVITVTNIPGQRNASIYDAALDSKPRIVFTIYKLQRRVHVNKSLQQKILSRVTVVFAGKRIYRRF